MGRKPCCTKEEGLNRGAWTATEDQMLIDYVKAHGEGKWRSIPKAAGLKRCGKSCRLRWLNYLRPDIKRGNITRDEEDLIIRLHKLLGNRWSLIAGRLPGRTDNEIKNYWNTVLSKRPQVMKGSKYHTTNKDGKKPRIIAPITSSGTTVIHAKAKRCSRVFITPQMLQQAKGKDHDDNSNNDVVPTADPSMEAKLLVQEETGTVESESSDDGTSSFTLLMSSKEESPKFSVDLDIGEIVSFSEPPADSEFTNLLLNDLEFCDINNVICEYGRNDCGQGILSAEDRLENCWSANGCCFEATLDSEFGFLANFLDFNEVNLPI